MNGSRYFSPDYSSARDRFLRAAAAAGLELESHPIAARGPGGEELAIDVASCGAAEPTRTVVVSSGLHGVEGFLGSACQLRYLEEHVAERTLPEGLRLVFLHALNPYGFAWVRRVNERNVDLNRNFLRPGERFEGAPEGYAELNGLLNPTRPPRRLSAFYLRAGATLARHGMTKLKNAVAGGQYDFPLGIFFGGYEPEETQRILDEHLGRWAGTESAETVYHVDFHSGLGPSATYKLLIDHPAGAPAVAELGAAFGADVVEPWEPSLGVAYEISGGLGTWAQVRYPDTRYEVLVAEFGTYPPIQVLRALHFENRAHHHGRGRTHGSTRWAKDLLKEAFAPADPGWRDTVVPRGVAIVERALRALEAQPQGAGSSA